MKYILASLMLFTSTSAFAAEVCADRTQFERFLVNADVDRKQNSIYKKKDEAQQQMIRKKDERIRDLEDEQASWVEYKQSVDKLTQTLLDDRTLTQQRIADLESRLATQDLSWIKTAGVIGVTAGGIAALVVTRGYWVKFIPFLHK